MRGLSTPASPNRAHQRALMSSLRAPSRPQDPVTRLQQRLSIISAELKSVTEAEYRSGLVGEALPPSPRLAESELVQELLNNVVVAPERLAPEREQQQAEQQMEQQVAEAPAPAPATPPAEAREQQHAAPPRMADGKGGRPEGTGREVLLQVGTAPAALTCPAPGQPCSGRVGPAGHVESTGIAAVQVRADTRLDP